MMVTSALSAEQLIQAIWQERRRYVHEAESNSRTLGGSP